ncbi:MAG TPA: hypothetical protein VES00_13125 [Burkholderiaceae bacterium]|nr:hypothetical protein [Burkholderiaceae bacterium]
MSIRSRAPGPLAAIALSVLAGCAAQLQPVADFGAAANRLAAVYKPFTVGMGASCEQRERYAALGNPGAFDAAAAQRAAASKCKALREAGATAALFGQALADYATALAKVSGTKPTVFDGELKGLSGAARQIEARDGTPVFDSAKLGAAGRIARAAAALATQGKVQSLTRATLEDNQDALRVVVDAMKTYAGQVYAGQLADTRDVMAGELGRLVAASDAPTQADVESRMPWRFAQTAARADIAANELEARRVREFDRTADALLAAHADLIAHFDRIGGARRLELVAAFVAQVQAINDDAAAL